MIFAETCWDLVDTGSFANETHILFHLRTHCLAQQHSKPRCSLMTVLARFCFIRRLSKRSATSLDSVTGATKHVAWLERASIEMKNMWCNFITRIPETHQWSKRLATNNRSTGNYFETSAQIFARPSVATMRECGIPKVQGHKMFRGLLQDILFETDLWIVSEDHLATIVR